MTGSRRVQAAAAVDPNNWEQWGQKQAEAKENQTPFAWSRALRALLCGARTFWPAGISQFAPDLVHCPAYVAHCNCLLWRRVEIASTRWTCMNSLSLCATSESSRRAGCHANRSCLTPCSHPAGTCHQASTDSQHCVSDECKHGRQAWCGRFADQGTVVSCLSQRSQPGLFPRSFKWSGFINFVLCGLGPHKATIKWNVGDTDGCKINHWQYDCSLQVLHECWNHHRSRTNLAPASSRSKATSASLMPSLARYSAPLLREGHSVYMRKKISCVQLAVDKFYGRLSTVGTSNTRSREVPAVAARSEASAWEAWWHMRNKRRRRG